MISSRVLLLYLKLNGCIDGEIFYIFTDFVHFTVLQAVLKIVSWRYYKYFSIFGKKMRFKIDTRLQ